MASNTQFPVPNTVESLRPGESAAAAVVRLVVGLDVDGRYHLAEAREDLITEVFFVKQADGRYHLNSASAGAKAIAYFPAAQRAVL